MRFLVARGASVFMLGASIYGSTISCRGAKLRKPSNSLLEREAPRTLNRAAMRSQLNGLCFDALVAENLSAVA